MLTIPSVNIDVTKIKVGENLSVFPRLKKLFYEDSLCRLTAVVAGPGYGKSALLMELLNIFDEAVYFSANEGDKDINVFLKRLYTWISERHGYAKKMDGLERKCLGDSGNSAEVSELIINYFRSRKRIILLIDNFEHICSVPSINEFVQLLLQQLNNIYIVIAGREEVHVNLPYLMAKGVAERIDERELCFSKRELSSFLNEAWQFHIDGKTLDLINELTGGWQAAVKLMARLGKKRLVDENIKINDIVEEAKYILDEYFEKEIFEMLPGQVKEFLLKTSSLCEFNEEKALRITGFPHSGEIIRYLCARHLFIEKISVNRHEYKYHPLFRDCLMRKARKAFSEKIENKVAEKSIPVNEAQVENFDKYKSSNKKILSIQTLGDLKIIYDGKIIDLKKLRRKKLRSLFQYFITHPDQIVPAEKLMEEFWPGLAPKKARHNLNTYIYMFRKFLEDSLDKQIASGLLTKEGDAYKLNLSNLDAVWIDYREFMYLCGHCKELWINGDKVKGIELGYKTREIYKGDYMPSEIYEDWTVLLREKLKENYIWINQKIAEYHWERGEKDIALQHLETLLEYEPIREELHRLLMEWYYAAGKRTRAIKQYKILKKILKTQLNVSPEYKTVQLYKDIKA